MGTVLLMVVAIVMQFAPVDQVDCFATPIVRNGLVAWDAGVTQIGPYLDRASYRVGGIDYIRRACSESAAELFAVNNP